jgi:copper chaperone CopZ
MSEKKITILIEGMHCNHCAAGIADGLKKLNGVKTADVLFTTNKAKVVYDPDAIKVEEMVRTVKEMGYNVKGVKE